MSKEKDLNRERKKSLTLKDKDFIIQDGALFLNKELKPTELEATELNIELSDKMISKITESAVKESIMMDMMTKQHQNFYDGNPVPMPFTPYGPTPWPWPEPIPRPWPIPIPRPWPPWPGPRPPWPGPWPGPGPLPYEADFKVNVRFPKR